LPRGIGKAIRRGIQSSLSRAGVEVVRRRPHHLYVPDVYGLSAFKHIDIRELQPFGALAAECLESRKSCLYYDRLYTIFQALQDVTRLIGPGETARSVEVGVYRGGTSRFIGASAQALGLELVHHAFDTFEGHAAPDIRDGMDADHVPGLFGDTSYEAVREYLSAYPNIQAHKGRFQDNCDRIAGERFHFVHLDVDIYAVTQFGLKFFEERLVPGGVIVVDDYGFVSTPGAKQAVDEFTAGGARFSQFHLLTGQCVLVKYASE